MCGSSYASIKGKNVLIFLGYHGGNFDIIGTDGSAVDLSTPEKFMSEMNKFTKQDLINIISQFIDNAEEG